MTPATLFAELCCLATTLETLSASERDPALTIALKAIVADLDRLIDDSVESGLVTTEAATA